MWKEKYFLQALLVTQFINTETILLDVEKIKKTFLSY